MAKLMADMNRVRFQTLIRVSPDHPVVRMAANTTVSLSEIVLLGDMMIAGGAEVSADEFERFFPEDGQGVPLKIMMSVNKGLKPFVHKSFFKTKGPLVLNERTIHIAKCLIVAARHVYGGGAKTGKKKPVGEGLSGKPSATQSNLDVVKDAF
jgi:hypothetical protein